MLDELKKIFLVGIGSAAYTYDKAAELVDELVEKGKLTIDEGKELSQELRANLMDKTKEATEKYKPLTKDDMKELLSGMNLATKDEIEELKKRLDKLENKSE